MNDESNRPVGGDVLGARLELARVESQRLREQHREISETLHRTVDALNRFIFTRTDADDGAAPQSEGCSQPASPSA